MFEQSLVALEGRAADPRRLFFLPAALLLHGALVAGFTLANTWAVQEIGEPRLIDPYVPQITVELQQQSPPERPPTASPPVRPTTAPPAPPPAGPVQPETITELAPVDPTRSGEDVPETAVTGPGGGGTDVVGPGGPGTVEQTGPPGDGGPPEVQRYTIGMTRPEPLAQVTPRYPATARAAHREGTVVLEAVIDEDGRVTDVQVLRGLGLGCDEAAVDAVRQWRFRPASIQGRPIKILYTLTVHFQLRR